MKTLTVEEVANLQLKEDEAILISVSGGMLTEGSIDNLREFIECCRRGDTPAGLVLEGESRYAFKPDNTTITVSVIKARELTTKMILLQEGDQEQIEEDSTVHIVKNMEGDTYCGDKGIVVMLDEAMNSPESGQANLCEFCLGRIEESEK